MSKLNIDQKSIKELLSDKKSDFLIPDYQRPYAWGEKECQTLWDDLFTFAFPDENKDKFSPDTDEYFLGPIVTFKNSDGKLEIIDGQQRLTTLMLLLRAFYSQYGGMKDEKSVKTSKMIAQCLWKTDEYGDPDETALKINSEVISEKEKDEFLQILKTGEADSSVDSNYKNNYLFFQQKILDFLQRYPDYFSLFPVRIMNNSILLPIEAESQDTALRIFSTLNDRGKPLSDADIFKAQFYKHYSHIGEKAKFIERWRNLEALSNSIFHPSSGTPMDELFTRYMYFERAQQGLKSSTTEALRKFYERDSYKLLKRDETFENLEDLANFWNDILNQDPNRFSDRILRRLYVLNYAPNGMWTYIVSVYYLANRDKNGSFDEAFYTFLNKITGFIWAYAITNPGVNALRTPIFAEMVNIINGQPVEFKDFAFNVESIQSVFNNFSFKNSRTITKSMLAWWAFEDPDQQLLSLSTPVEIEHIYARNRQDKEHSLTNAKNIDNLGNKVLLEKRINVRASDYRFEDKKKYYQGYKNKRNKQVEGTSIKELMDLARSNSDFSEADILQRNAKIISSFINYLNRNSLLKRD